jgi:hypothetical protein
LAREFIESLIKQNFVKPCAFYMKTRHCGKMRSPPAVPKQKSSVLRNRIVAFGKTLRNLKLIATDLPGLTLHDERHFEALWRRADQIAGCQYHLNPLELFVFGGSILLHDAGLTLGAYSGGLQALTQT